MTATGPASVGNTYVGSYASDSRDNAAIESRNTAFSLIHLGHCRPHARELLGLGAQLSKRGRLNGKAGSHNVEWVGEENRCDSSNAAAG